MEYVVRPGDSLWRIAAARFGDGDKWRAIAEDNHLYHPNRIVVGQRLQLRDSLLVPTRIAEPVLTNAPLVPTIQFSIEHSTSVVPARAFFFVLGDEVNPFRSKVVRKVMVSEAMAAAYAKSLGRPIPVMPNPERFGLHSTGPESPVSLGRHALGMKPSPFSSASKSPLGAARIGGNRFWVDVEKAKRAGATIHETDEILQDLDRIARKTAKSIDLARIETIKALVKADAEVAIKGAVPAAAIKGATSMAVTRGLQGVQLVGFVMTAIDMGHAVDKSVQLQSLKPVTAETMRQAGGWAAAWAGMELGAAGGAALGIETGPGAILTGAVGGLIGGVAGYLGCDWIADHIDAN